MFNASRRLTHQRPNTTPEDPTYIGKLKDLQGMIGEVTIPSSVRKGIQNTSLRATREESMYKRLVMDVDYLITRVKTRPTTFSIADLETPAPKSQISPKHRRTESPAMNRFRKRAKAKIGPGSYHTEDGDRGPSYCFTAVPRMTDLLDSLERKPLYRLRSN